MGCFQFRYRFVVFLGVLLALTFNGRASSRADKQASSQDAQGKPTTIQIPALTFDEVWRQVRAHSEILQAYSSEVAGLQEAKARSARHWYPILNLGGRSLQTDDPGTVLFSKLGERNVDGTDFSPLTMNFPVSQRHDQVTLGVQWSLFSGGGARRRAESAEHSLESKKMERKAAWLQQYAQSLRFYGSLVAWESKKSDILEIQSILKKTLERYQIGSKSNPLGYSGLLGLRNIENRIDGTLKMLETQKISVQGFLLELGRIQPPWRPNANNLIELLDREIEGKLKSQDLVDGLNAGNSTRSANSTLSEQSAFSVKSLELASEATASMAKAKLAHFLPDIRFFAERSYFQGTQSSVVNSSTIGLMMNWELFNATQYGAMKETLAQSAALRLKSEAQGRMIRALRNQNSQMILSLREQLKLALQSQQYLREQSEVSSRLFQSGIINALQLVEVYSRRLDLIEAVGGMLESYLKLQAEIIENSSLDLETGV